MAHLDSSLPAPQRPSRLPQLLLYGLAIALICCILGGGVLYLYNAFTNVVSTYRRGMNAAAYTAQVYSDQRETMLRWVTASLLPIDSGTHPPGVSPSRSEDLLLVQIMGSDNEPRWTFALTPREKEQLKSLRLRVLHTSLESGTTRYLDTTDDILPDAVQAWIAAFLAGHTATQEIGGPPSPILWLRPPSDTDSRLFLYTLLDANDPTQGWIGIESDGYNLPPQTVGRAASIPNYLLLNPAQYIIVKNGVYLDQPFDFRERIKLIPGDDFRITWKDQRPNYLVLSKFIGEGGWRLIYYIRFSDMLRHGDLPIAGVAATVLLLCLLVTVSLRQIRAKLLIPAMQQYTALQDSEHSLRLAKQKADAANQAKSEFLAIMSHEIRTPLFGITGTLELLSLTALAPHQRQYLHTAQSSATTLLSTINETLNLPHGDADPEQLQISELSPAHLLNSVVASYADRAMAKGILLYGIVDCNTPDIVAGDEFRIRRILNNLINNAIKFTAYGQVVVRLCAQEPSPGMSTLIFQVADTGIGIAPDAQKPLFSAYYQAKPTPTQSPEGVGTGLGLFICKRLADMMQGALTATSAPGLGTSIIFTVPLSVCKQTSAIRLQPERVYVRGAIQEIVLNLCAWLNHWGLFATPYPIHDEACTDQTLLLQAWPPNDIELNWQGRKIIMLPPGQIPGESAAPGIWYSATHDIKELSRVLALAQALPTAQRPRQADTRLPSHNARVLAVDDNAINRQILAEQLRKLNCTVILATDGQHALSLLRRQEVDLILTDINMPVMNGYALTRHVRDQGYTMPIYGVTAMMLTTERHQADAAGMTELLPRPLSIATLSELLQHIDKRVST